MPDHTVVYLLTAARITFDEKGQRKALPPNTWTSAVAFFRKYDPQTLNRLPDKVPPDMFLFAKPNAEKSEEFESWEGLMKEFAFKPEKKDPVTGPKLTDVNPFCVLIDKDAKDSPGKPTSFKENDIVGYACSLVGEKLVVPVYKADGGLLFTYKYGDSWFDFRRVYYATLGPRRQAPMPKEEAKSSAVGIFSRRAPRMDTELEGVLDPADSGEPPAAQEPDAQIDSSASQPLDVEVLKGMMKEDNEEPQEEVEKPLFK